jgi:hypothetical protein
VPTGVAAADPRDDRGPDDDDRGGDDRLVPCDRDREGDGCEGDGCDRNARSAAMFDRMPWMSSTFVMPSSVPSARPFASAARGVSYRPGARSPRTMSMQMYSSSLVSAAHAFFVCAVRLFR